MMDRMVRTVALLLTSLSIASASAPEALRLAQHAEYVRGDVKAALAGYEQLVHAGPPVDADAALGIVRSLRKLGRIAEARRRLDALERMSPTLKERAPFRAERLRLERAGGEGAPAPASPVPSAEREERVSLELKDTQVGVVARLLGERMGRTVVVAPEVAQRSVTVKLMDVAPETALRSIAASAGAELHRWDRAWAIATPEQARRLKLTATPAPAAEPKFVIALTMVESAPTRRSIAAPRVMTRGGEEARVTLSDVPVENRKYDVDVRSTPRRTAAGEPIRMSVDVSVSRREGARVSQVRRTATWTMKDGEKTSLDLTEAGVEVEVQVLEVAHE